MDKQPAATRETASGLDPIRESYGRTRSGAIWKQLMVGTVEGPRVSLRGPSSAQGGQGLDALWDQAWLQSRALPAVMPAGGASPQVFRVVDIFAGCGAMSLGVKAAVEALGLRFESLFAADFEPSALGVYERNLSPKDVFDGDILGLVEWSLRETRGRQRIEGSWRKGAPEGLAGRVDLLIGGPPCQGHSDLNNHSRRDDPKNALYLVMPALAHLLSPRAVFIENVPAVVHDRGRVVETATRVLTEAGYFVTSQVVSLATLGVAQRRRRHVLLATKDGPPDVQGVLRALETSERSVHWAIGDLRLGESLIDTASRQTKDNVRRIDWLFDNDAFDLPNRLRPDCHRLKKHSYVSMYGRMHPEVPAQTITSGFGSPGQGRFIHPAERRTLTPHEAARIQFFPDSYTFESTRGPLSRVHLAQMIGNAVPPKLSYAMTLAVLAARFGTGLPR